MIRPAAFAIAVETIPDFTAPALLIALLRMRDIAGVIGVHIFQPIVLRLRRAWPLQGDKDRFCT